MSAHTIMTRGVRLRTTGIPLGKTAELRGEWLVAPYQSAVPSVTVGKIGESSPVFVRHRGAQETEQNFSDIIEELQEGGSLGMQEENALGIEATEEDFLVVSADDSATLENARLLIELLGQRLSDLEKADMERIIDAVVPSLVDRLSPAFIDQARRNAEAHTAFLREYEVLDADQVHELFGLKGRNRSALAARWRSDKKTFAVQHRGRFLYPAFQFDAQGCPRQVISKLLALLGTKVGGWQTALRFVTPNGWLDEEKPVDMLEREPHAVLDAAADVAEPVAH